MNALRLILKPNAHGWAVGLTDGRELARFHSAAAILGDNAGYLIGRKGRRWLLLSPGPFASPRARATSASKSSSTATPPRPQPKESPAKRGFRVKRLKGLEPSTFCMASRRSSQLSYSRTIGAV
jgi:hypothetical protein